MGKRKPTAVTLTEEAIYSQIFIIRKHKIMLDFHLADLYEVDTKVLNQAVKRNPERFPADFMFQLSVDEWESLRSQFVTSKNTRGGRRYAPYAFTELCKALHNSVKAKGGYLGCFPRPFFKDAICDLKELHSSGVSSNIKSSGKRAMFLLTKNPHPIILKS